MTQPLFLLSFLVDVSLKKIKDSLFKLDIKVDSGKKPQPLSGIGGSRENDTPSCIAAVLKNSPGEDFWDALSSLMRYLKELTRSFGAACYKCPPTICVWNSYFFLLSVNYNQRSCKFL